MPAKPDYSLEYALSGIVAGIDEAGRGPWAGPVVASAVVLDIHALPNGINDSKKIPAGKRELLYDAIMRTARTGVGMASVEEIDSMNILNATKLAMQRAMAALSFVPDHALVDGNRAPILPCLTHTVVGGDAKSLSIAAASIVAKVTRDRIMQRLALEHPHYGWEKNAGYGTAKHIEGLRQFGLTQHHRRSYAPIRKILEETEQAETV